MCVCVCVFSWLCFRKTVPSENGSICLQTCTMRRGQIRRHGKTARQANRRTYRQANRWTYRQANRWTYRQANGLTHGQAHRPAHRWDNRDDLSASSRRTQTNGWWFCIQSFLPFACFSPQFTVYGRFHTAAELSS